MIEPKTLFSTEEIGLSRIHVIISDDYYKEGLEKLMFNDPLHVKKLLNIMNGKLTPESEKNDRHQLLETLIEEKGEKLKTRKNCPFCGKEKVKRFSVRYSDGVSISPEYVCCGMVECRNKMLGSVKRNLVNVYDFRFSVLRNIQKNYGKESNIFKKFKKIFRWAFGVSWKYDRARLTNETAYNVFF